MQALDPRRLEKLAESLAIAFYVFMFLAFVTAVLGSPGSGFFLLIIGACAHVVRAALQEFIADRQVPDDQLDFDFQPRRAPATRRPQTLSR
jgi:hypothetical protein